MGGSPWKKYPHHIQGMGHLARESEKTAETAKIAENTLVCVLSGLCGFFFYS
jgi:hypothetical protein